MSFKLFGVKFEIDYIFVSLFVIYIAVDRTGIILQLLGSIIIHELSHLLCILLFKSKVKAVKLIVGVISVEYADICESYKKIIALLAGPVSNIALALILKMLNNDVVFALNIVIAIYNLLPLDGLDGGAIAAEIFTSFLPENKARNILLFINLFFLTSISLMWFLFFKNNVFILIVVLYLFTPFIFKKILKDKHL